MFDFERVHKPFLFIRHGETPWNAEPRRMQGHSDIPLNETGLAQAQQAQERIVKAGYDISQIYSSDLSRAYQTASIINEALEKPLSQHQDLRERDYGSDDGILVTEFIQKGSEDLGAPSDLMQHGPTGLFYADDAEAFQDFTIRIFSRLVDVLTQDTNEGTPLIVAHSGVFSCLHYHLCGEYIRIENARPCLFEPQKSTHSNADWQVTMLDESI